MKFRRAIICNLIGLILFSCSEDLPTEPNESIYPDLGLMKADSAEAREMAHYWDNTLYGSDSTFESLLYHVNYMREIWGDSLPWIKSQRFMLPWWPGELLLGLDSASAEEFRSGNYEGFNQLEEYLRPDSVGEVYSWDGVLIYYDESFNMSLIAESIQGLPGIRYAEPNGVLWVSIASFPLRYGLIEDEWAFVMLKSNSIFDKHYISFESGEPLYRGVINWSETDSTILAEVKDVEHQWSYRDDS